MNLITDFKPFYANNSDPGPKTVTFIPPTIEQIDEWLPEEGSVKILNSLSNDKTHVLQKMEGSEWSEVIKDLGPKMRFEPATTGYALTDVNGEIGTIDINESGWSIVKWNIVATDINGNDIDKVEVDRRIGNKEDFFICDKLFWKLGTREVITKHGYQHYRE